MIRLIVMEPSPSLNVTLRMHGFAMSKLKKRWGALLLLAGANKHPPATGRRRVTLARYGKRQLDTDNLYGGGKMIVDELRRYKLIVDDDPKHVELVCENGQLKKGERPWTLIVIEDI